jgi:hypothetical protein
MRPALFIGVLMALWLGLAAGAGAAGGTYTVVKCHELNRTLSEAKIVENAQYVVQSGCADAGSLYSSRIESIGNAGIGRRGALRWSAPEATGITGVRLQARLRRAAGHRSRLYMAQADGLETKRVATGDADGGGWRFVRWTGARQQQFVASLECERRAGCRQSDEAKTWVRNIQLTLADYADPVVNASGTIYTGGWLRGERRVAAEVSDAGSGIKKAVVLVNGSELANLALGCPGAIPGSVFASTMEPCPDSGSFQPVEPTTTALPFHDGQNSVAVCARDFAGNETCDTRLVRVDNTPPTLAFFDAQAPEDPELIRALVADPTSGVASGQILFRRVGVELWRPLETQIVGGELRARVDSAAEPAGDYELMAEATDAAGNVQRTQLREDGLPKQLSFPLRQRVDLTAAIKPGGSKRVAVGYGKRTRAVGSLRDARGKPLEEQEVILVERFGTGALIDRRVRRVRTDSHGRWSAKLRAGPSRSIKAYFAGTPRYLDARAKGGRLSVKTKATFKVSRQRVPEGKPVVFKGRVRSRGARIPRGGKLLELQVRQGPGRWITVREAFRTRSSGRYRMRYRFGRFYAYDTSFKFRVKVARERDWPYKAVRSRSRTVTVLAR